MKTICPPSAEKSRTSSVFSVPLWLIEVVVNSIPTLNSARASEIEA
jgi:hypothetical protein